MYTGGTNTWKGQPVGGYPNRGILSLGGSADCCPCAGASHYVALTTRVVNVQTIELASVGPSGPRKAFFRCATRRPRVCGWRLPFALFSEGKTDAHIYARIWVRGSSLLCGELGEARSDRGEGIFRSCIRHPQLCIENVRGRVRSMQGAHQKARMPGSGVRKCSGEVGVSARSFTNREEPRKAFFRCYTVKHPS